MKEREGLFIYLFAAVHTTTSSYHEEEDTCSNNTVRERSFRLLDQPNYSNTKRLLFDIMVLQFRIKNMFYLPSILLIEKDPKMIRNSSTELKQIDRSREK